jgi:hypothetical protein
MSGRNDGLELTRIRDVLFLPATAKTVPQKEIDALEAKRIRRMIELGNWRPSGGWHIEPSLT